jgi:hypothetical protein
VQCGGEGVSLGGRKLLDNLHDFGLSQIHPSVGMRPKGRPRKN